MKVVKRINNNVILATDNDSEVLLMGKGLGFQKYPNDNVEISQIERIFYPESSLSIEQMTSLLTIATEKEIGIIQAIIDMFRAEVIDEFNPNLLFTLSDHVLFSIQRLKNQVVIPMVPKSFEWEIKMTNPKEYELARKAVKMIRKELNPQFPEKEVAFIALHFVNAKITIKDSDNQAFSEFAILLQGILEIVEREFDVNNDTNSVFYDRFITHVKYFLYRQLQGNLKTYESYHMVTYVFENFSQEKEIAIRIKDYLAEKKAWTISNVELMYLTLHILNLTRELEVSK